VGKLLVCYISGLDLRHVDAKSTPCLAAARARGPFVPLRNMPSNELFPTLVTGVPPPRHGVWGVTLREPPAGLFDALIDALPAAWTTSWQCLRHWSDRRYDLAAVPPARRRRLALTRTKYKRRTLRAEALFRIGRLPTVFDVVGPERSRYRFSASYDPCRQLLPHVGRGDVDLEVLELYSLDRHQQWNLDREDETRRFYGVVDAFLDAARRSAACAGVTLMVVSDHGHERVRHSIDLFRGLQQLGVGALDADWFVEVSSARFWFRDAAKRRDVERWLAATGHASLRDWREMPATGIELTDGRYGELFCFLDPGCIFFPHDFHHPLANLWLGLSDPLQRARLRDPRHRGNHGHLPDFDAERSFACLLDPAFEAARDEGSVLDVAPTILSLLARPAPASMGGAALFRPRGGAGG
jgi:hypothetical protein